MQYYPREVGVKRQSAFTAETGVWELHYSAWSLVRPSKEMPWSPSYKSCRLQTRALGGSFNILC